jgi:RNA polymerase sigma-70 factor, ECF subfamily
VRTCRTSGVSFEADLIAWLPQLRRYARALTGDAARADDLVQETAERALARWKVFRPNSNCHSSNAKSCCWCVSRN